MHCCLIPRFWAFNVMPAEKKTLSDKHFEIIIIWLGPLAPKAMFSFRLSQANELCRWSWFWRWQEKWNKQAEESVTCGFRPLYRDSRLEFVTLRKIAECVRACARGHGTIHHTQNINLYFKGPHSTTAKRKTPPLHLSPTRKHRQIYDTQGMSEERSAFIRATFPTVAH